MGEGGGQSGGRRLLEVALPQPQIVPQNQVVVNLESVVGGYFYLTGGVPPLVTAAPVSGECTSSKLGFKSYRVLHGSETDATISGLQLQGFIITVESL